MTVVIRWFQQLCLWRRRRARLWLIWLWRRRRLSLTRGRGRGLVFFIAGLSRYFRIPRRAWKPSRGWGTKRTSVIAMVQHRLELFLMHHLQLLHLLEMLLLQAGEQGATGRSLEAAETGILVIGCTTRRLSRSRTSIILRKLSSKISPGRIHPLKRSVVHKESAHSYKS